ncbi:MAG: hypothetical protein B9S32_07605 [Verrucomicrobia bacterium Tous-C9LFEB]|nr:MAG: hypothetical protein B9S32_07605 [Verrucomicrobia bacterium Tous-C9LFEB]
MRKPVLTSFGVLIGTLIFALAIISLFRFVAQAKSKAAKTAASPHATVATAPGFPLHFRDAFGREIVLPAPPQRIVSLAPSLTELIFALGAGDRIVADTTYCIHPPEAIAKTKIGGIMDPDMEKMLGLHPDLVVGSGLTPQEVVRQIDRLNIHAAYFRHTSIESVYRDTVDLATLLGLRERGEKIVADMRQRGEALTKQLQSLPPGPRPKVLLLLRINGLYSAGKGSFPHELIQLAGGDNIAAQAATMWPQLAMETVIQNNPDVILVAIGKGKVDGDFLQKEWLRMRVDPRWSKIKAVANNRLVLVPDDLLTIPGPRLMEAAEIIAYGLHPELAPAKR